MTYIVKYLPVEDGYKRVVKNAEGIPIDYEYEVKLFLTTTDIKVGDRVRRPSLFNGKPDLEFTVNKIEEREDGKYYREGDEVFDTGGRESRTFKVVGEISPDVTFLSDGDEVDEEDVKVVHRHVYKCLCKEKTGYEDESCPEYSGGTNKYVDGCYRKEDVVWYYNIRCKCCKKFV